MLARVDYNVPLDGETVTDVLTAILHRDPDWDALPRVPLHVERVLRRSMSKDQRERFRDVGDVAMLLREPATDDAGPVPTAPPEGAGRFWPVVAAISTLALLAVLGWNLFGPTTGSTVGHSSISAN